MASANCGSDGKLAMSIHVHKANLSSWRSGRHPIPVGDVALLAELAGLNAVAITNEAILDKYINTPKEDLVRTALALEKRKKPRNRRNVDNKTLPLF